LDEDEEMKLQKEGELMEQLINLDNGNVGGGYNENDYVVQV
jgi:hypothetical protein